MTGQDDLTIDTAFFEDQAQAYDQWLKKIGMGPILSVQEITIKPSSLSLYLKFSDSNIDYVVQAWDSLKTNFERDQSITLEQHLFYKAVHFMQVSQDQIDVQIYDTYDVTVKELFMRAIYFSDGIIKVETNDHRGPIEKVTIPKLKIKKGAQSTKTIERAYDKDYVFRKIIQGARDFYGSDSKKIDGRIPAFETLSTLDNLRFEVANLTREVVTDASNGIFCPLIKSLGFGCNWSPREVLTFTITHDSLDNDTIQLTIELDGRIGSGVYASAKRKSYINLEVEHQSQLEKYALKMREKIYNWVTGRP